MAKNKFLDLEGLVSLKNKIIALFSSHTSNDNIHTSTDEKDKLNEAYLHSTSTHARIDATKVEKSSTNGNVLINGLETNIYTHPGGTNPHGTTKSDVGLGNVGNYKSVSIVANQGLSDTEKSNARENIGAGTSSFSGSYNDLSNKPTIPTVGNGTITIKQDGTTKGTFTTNQSGDTTIELTDNNTHYKSMNVVGSSSSATSDTSSALTNGNVYLNSVENDEVMSSHKITGAGGTTVTTDESGNIIVESKNTTDSTYYKGTSAPSNTSLLWIDTSNGGIIKYYDSTTSSWKPTMAVWG